MKLGFYWDEFYSSKFAAVMSIVLTLMPTILLILLFFRAVYDLVLREMLFKNKINKTTPKSAQISKIRKTSKLLLLSSLMWSICYGAMAVSFVFLHLFLDLTPINCGDRSIGSIFYAFQRTSLMLFFISRLHYTFANTIFEIKRLYIKLFVVITFIVYNGAAIWYVIASHETEKGVYCKTIALAAPTITVSVIDVTWNLFLGIYFQRKLKEVLYISMHAFIFNIHNIYRVLQTPVHLLNFAYNLDTIQFVIK